MLSHQALEIDDLYALCGNSGKAVQALADRLGVTEKSWYLRALAVIKLLKAKGEWKGAR